MFLRRLCLSGKADRVTNIFVSAYIIEKKGLSDEVPHALAAMHDSHTIGRQDCIGGSDGQKDKETKATTKCRTRAGGQAEGQRNEGNDGVKNDRQKDKETKVATK